MDTERSSIDEIIELYKRDVDRTLLRENLRKSVDQRMRDMIDFMEFLHTMRQAGLNSRANQKAGA